MVIKTKTNKYKISNKNKKFVNMGKKNAEYIRKLYKIFYPKN